jgi:ATP-dependent DNA ligase
MLNKQMQWFQALKSNATLRRKPMGFIKGPHPKTSISPDESSISDALKNGFIGQKKINGARCQIHIVDGKIESLFTRQGTLHTQSMADYLIAGLTEAWSEPGKTILEGEWIRFDHMQRLYLFDCLMHESALLRTRTYLERYDFLKDKKLDSLTLQTLPILTTLKECMTVISGNNSEIEGLVFKAKDGRGFEDYNIIRCRKR